MSKANRVEVEDYDETEELLENIQSGVSLSTCASLIVKVSEYVKKPLIEHDLTGILSTYLGLLQESDIYIQNGIFNTNFAEAALLLQSSVQLYGKKVDLLWDSVIEYLNRNMAYEEKTEDNKDEFELLEERKGKFKRKRKVIEENVEEHQRAPKKTFIVDKASACIQGMHFSGFQTFLMGTSMSNDDPSPNHCNLSKTYKENWKQRTRQCNTTVFEQNLQHGDTLPAKNLPETRLVSNLESTIVHEEMAPIQHDLTELNFYGEKEPMGDYGNSSVFDQINRQHTHQHRQVHHCKVPETKLARADIQDFVLQRWITEKSMRVDQVYARWDEFVVDCRLVEDHLYKHTTAGSFDDNHKICSFKEPSNADMFDSFLSEKCSPTDKGKCMGFEENMLNEINQELGVLLDQKNESIRKRVDSDIESGVFDTFSTSNGTSPTKTVNSLGAMSVLSDCIGADSRGVSPVPGQTPVKTDQTITEEIRQDKCEERRKKLKKRLFEDLDEDGNVIIPPKRQRRVKERPRPVITTDLHIFTKFFLQHYTPADGEGELDPFEDDADDNVGEELGDVTTLNDSAYDTANELNTTDCTVADKTELSSSFIESSALQGNSTAGATSAGEKSFADIMGQDASIRLQDVLEWKKFITEKIGQQRKSDFDIHVEEGKIIEDIGKVGASVKYDRMCAGMSAADVSHNFIALLHLANTHNIEMSGIQRGSLSNDTLGIKLLSTDRHHEHLDEYNAPSTEEMYEKMVSVNDALKRQNVSSSRKQKSTKTAKTYC